MKRIITCSIISLAALAGGCAGPGRCVGIAAEGVPAGAKVLTNINNEGLVIEGYDPVAYFTNKKPVKGDPAFRSSYGGGVYQFASAEHKAAFDGDPAKYAPQFGGYCAYAASIDTVSPVDPAFWEIVDGRLILQHNQRAWDKWHEDAAGNLVRADKNWPGLVEREGAPPRVLVNVDKQGLAIEGYDPVAYFTDKKPVKGDPALARTYNGATYHFASKEHKDTFEKSPSAYVPAFGGFCGYAASINKVSPVNPEIWQVVDGRLVLQHTPEAYRLFNQDVDASYTKANQNWPGLMARRCN